MQKSQINPQIANDLFASATNAADKGQSQFFTPPELARSLATTLPRHRGVIVDLNCGAAHLLDAVANGTTEHLLGADIDNCRRAANLGPRPPLSRITHDLTLLYSKLKEVGFVADLFALNPPWGLLWHRDRLSALAASEIPAVRQAFKASVGPNDTIDSTLATLLIALDLCTSLGEGFLIANHATVDRLIFAPGAPAAAVAMHIWAHVVIEGNPMTGETTDRWVKEDKFRTSVIYFARSHTRGPVSVQAADSTFAGLKAGLPDRGHLYSQNYKHTANEFTVQLWEATKEHVASLSSVRPQWNLWLTGAVLQTYVSHFEGSSKRINKANIARLYKLQGKTPMQLVMQRAERTDLLHSIQDAGWRVQPEAAAAVEKAIKEYHANRAPLYPLSDIKRLGYLDEVDFIECRHDLGSVFAAGKSYSIRTHTVDVTRTGMKPNSTTGELEKVTYSGQELGIYICSGDQEYVFMDGNLRAEGIELSITKQSKAANVATNAEVDFTLQELVRHFSIPEVPDVATLDPQGYQRGLDELARLEKLCGFKLKAFQKQDLARAALHLGLIMGWDTGLGKTWTLYLFPLLQCGFNSTMEADGIRIHPNGPVLILAPGDLHEQITKEAREVFKVNTTPIASQDDFYRLCPRDARGLPQLTADGRPMIPHGFYITSYTQLAVNGVNAMPNPAKWQPRALLEYLCLKIGEPDFRHTQPEYSLGEAETVLDFYALRNTDALWSECYETLHLDPNRAVLNDLERSLEREKEIVQRWPDPKSAANRLKSLESAAATLANLIPASRASMRVKFADLSPAQQDWVINQFCTRKLEQYSEKCGVTQAYPMGPPQPGYELGKPETDTRQKWKVKCVYSPSLADLSYNAFDAMCVDEAVRMKGADSLIGIGVRSMQPTYRNAASATPMKNRLPDLYSIAWWAAGGHEEATARFPFRDDPADRAAFAKKFMVSSLTEKHDAEGRPLPARERVTAEVCNIHLLWKLLGPIILRRRKQDCGEEIVKRIRKIYRCKLGTEQRRVYEYHLKATYLDRNGDPAIGAQLQALRQASAAPATDNLVAQLGKPTEKCPVCTPAKLAPSSSPAFEPATTEFRTGQRTTPACPHCKGLGDLPLPFRSSTNYTPKTATVLTLVKEILERKEQVVVFSAFNEPNDHLSQLLGEAGIRHFTLDGRTSQKNRASAAGRFKLGRTISNAIPVLLAGVDSMAEGHSFHRCKNVILYCYSWAYDKFKQALDRIHRMNSEFDVNVYVVLCDGTIDGRLESLTDEKSDAADLVLDGTLLGERPEEINFAELLQVARDEFNPTHQTIDESRLLSEWPQLRRALQAAALAWDDAAAVQTSAEEVTMRQMPNDPLSLGSYAETSQIPMPLEPVVSDLLTEQPSAPVTMKDRLAAIRERANRLRAARLDAVLAA